MLLLLLLKLMLLQHLPLRPLQLLGWLVTRRLQQLLLLL